MSKLRDWLIAIIPVVTLVVGIGWSSGQRDAKIEDMRATVDELKGEFKELTKSLTELRVAVAELNERERDDRHKGH